MREGGCLFVATTDVRDAVFGGNVREEAGEQARYFGVFL